MASGLYLTCTRIVTSKDRENMVGKKDIRALDFTTIEEYYNYILDSETNGQRKQTKDLYAQLSNPQKVAFRNWAREHISAEEVLNLIDVIS
jgi:hypothetical protein